MIWITHGVHVSQFKPNCELGEQISTMHDDCRLLRYSITALLKHILTNKYGIYSQSSCQFNQCRDISTQKENCCHGYSIARDHLEAFRLEVVRVSEQGNLFLIFTNIEDQN